MTADPSRNTITISKILGDCGHGLTIIFYTLPYRWLGSGINPKSRLTHYRVTGHVGTETKTPELWNPVTQAVRFGNRCLAVVCYSGHRHQRNRPSSGSYFSLVPCKNFGFSIVPSMRNGKDNLPSFNLAPSRRANMLVKKPCLVVMVATP